MSGATSTYGAVPTWDQLVVSAEMARQAAVAAGTTVAAADAAYNATMIAAALANGVSPATFQQAQAELNGRGHP